MLEPVELGLELTPDDIAGLENMMYCLGQHIQVYLLCPSSVSSLPQGCRGTPNLVSLCRSDRLHILWESPLYGLTRLVLVAWNTMIHIFCLFSQGSMKITCIPCSDVVHTVPLVTFRRGLLLHCGCDTALLLRDKADDR